MPPPVCYCWCVLLNRYFFAHVCKYKLCTLNYQKYHLINNPLIQPAWIVPSHLNPINSLILSLWSKAPNPLKFPSSQPHPSPLPLKINSKPSNSLKFRRFPASHINPHKYPIHPKYSILIQARITDPPPIPMANQLFPARSNLKPNPQNSMPVGF